MSSARTPNSIRPSPASEELFDLMQEQDEIQREILTETLQARENGQILESGRTMCNSPLQVHGPLARFPTAVDLHRCPVSSGGAWHTHVTPDQIRSPENSLPDIAAVLFEQLDVIAVVGTESAEYLLSADDPDAARDELRDAIGEDVQSPSDVVDAIESGRIAPQQARRRVRQRLSPLFTTVTTGFTEMSVSDAGPEPVAASQPYEAVELQMAQQDVAYHDLMTNPHGVNLVASEMGRQAEQMSGEKIPGDISGTATGAAVGTIVGTIVDRILFD